MGRPSSQRPQNDRLSISMSDASVDWFIIGQPQSVLVPDGPMTGRDETGSSIIGMWVDPLTPGRFERQRLGTRRTDALQAAEQEQPRHHAAPQESAQPPTRPRQTDGGTAASARCDTKRCQQLGSRYQGQGEQCPRGARSKNKTVPRLCFQNFRSETSTAAFTTTSTPITSKQDGDNVQQR